MQGLAAVIYFGWGLREITHAWPILTYIIIRFPADIRLRKEHGSLLHITAPTSIGAYVQNGRPL